MKRRKKEREKNKKKYITHDNHGRIDVPLCKLRS